MKKLYLLLLILPGFLSAQITLTPPTSYRLCDANSDGTEAFDLTTKNAEIMGTLDPSLYSIAYFQSLTDANSNTSPLDDSSYAPASFPAVVWARVWENANPANYGTVVFSLLLQALPTAYIDASADVCVNGFAYFIFYASNGTAPYTFYYTINGGPEQTITSSQSTSSIVLSLQNNEPNTFNLVLTGVTESSLGCMRNLSATASVTIHPATNIFDPQDMIVEDSPFDGLATFNLATQETVALGGQSGYSTALFLTQADADSNSAQLTPAVAAAFQNTTNPQTIWIAITNDATGCRAITDFHLIVTPPASSTVYIPDTAFKAKLIEASPANSIAYGATGYVKIDANNDGEIQLTEAQSITKLDVSYSTIVDLTGVEKFTNLNKFESMNNLNLSVIDVAPLVNLDSLIVGNGKVTGLSLPAHPNLKYLDCRSNKISSLSIGNSPNLKYLACSGNKLTSLDVASFTALETLACTNNFSINSLDLSTLVNLKTLSCAVTNLFNLSLENLSNLQYLDFTGNSISTIDLSPVPNLTYLDCTGNNIAALDLSPMTLLTELYCSYNELTTLDATPMTNIQKLDCKGNKLTSLNVTGSTNLKHLDCGVNFIEALDLHDLANLQILDCSMNAISTLNLNGCANLLNADCGVNQITSVDLSSLANLQVFQASSNLLTELDFSHNPLTGEYVYNGQIYVSNQLWGHNPNLVSINLKNGTLFTSPPTTSDLTNVPNLVYICIDDNDQELAQLSAIITPAISVNSYCSFTPGGDYNTISGTVRYDSNANGCDAADAVYPYMKVNISDGLQSGSTFTNTTGNYSFFTDAGNFSITPDIENSSFFSISAPASVAFPSENNLTATRNFCVAPNGVHPDLEIVIAPIVPARPGFDAVYKIVYKNKGNQVMSAPSGVSFSYNNNLMTFLSATPNVAAQTAGTLSWDYANLMPFESRSIMVTMHVNAPTDANPVNVGNILVLTGVVSPQNLDENAGDNIFQFNQTVIGSYDPNDISCIEGEVVSPSEIGDYLHYLIRFENTGTDFAQNIVVRNIIDETQFDVSSLRIMNSSHQAEVKVTGNKAEYIFQDINLAIGGHGNILLKIKSKGNLPVGSTVSNKANIYFDYNLPVDTNMANTTFQQLGIGAHELDPSISVYPNPAHNIINIKASTAIKSVQLYDVQGRILQTSLANENISSIDISNQQAGIYFVKIISDKGMKVEKIMKK